MDFTGKVALVAGGGSGIGRATCEILAQRGGAMVVADANEASAKATAENIARTGGRAEAVGCDISRWDQVQGAIETTRRVFGRLDILVNTAGILRIRSLEGTSDTEWNEVLQVNLTGAFLLTKAAMKTMREQGSGAIVHTASRMAIRIKENRGAYAPSKAGMLALTRMAALEGAPDIRVNCVLPGWIDTPMTRGSGTRGQVEAQFAGWARICPLGRAGRADEVARAILFLASEEASFITGVALPVDGGRTILSPLAARCLESSGPSWLPGKAAWTVWWREFGARGSSNTTRFCRFHPSSKKRRAAALFCSVDISGHASHQRRGRIIGG